MTTLRTTRFVVEEYEDDSAKRPCAVAFAADEKEARRVAAEMLGRRTLRGASTWERYQGGTVYQYGPRRESNGYPFVVIIPPKGPHHDHDFQSQPLR